MIMRITKIIPYRFYEHKVSGRIASIYSSYPGDDWELKERGYTWVCDNGTTGCCRVPAKTLQEAEEFMARFNNPDGK